MNQVIGNQSWVVSGVCESKDPIIGLLVFHLRLVEKALC